MSLVAFKGQKINVKIQGPYCEVPGPVLGHQGVLPAQMNPTMDSGIVIVAGAQCVGVCSGLDMDPCALKAIGVVCWEQGW